MKRAGLLIITILISAAWLCEQSSASFDGSLIKKSNSSIIYMPQYYGKPAGKPAKISLNKKQKKQAKNLSKQALLPVNGEEKIKNNNAAVIKPLSTQAFAYYSRGLLSQELDGAIYKQKHDALTLKARN